MAQLVIHGPDDSLLDMEEVRKHILGGVSAERVRELVRLGRFPRPLPPVGPKSPWQWTALTIACWLHLAPMMGPSGIEDEPSKGRADDDG